MRVNVKFFAIFREMTGIRTEWAEIAEGTTIEQLWKQYAARSPRVGNIRAAYAINQRLAKPDQLLRDGDEVGFLPPVSGGTQEVKRAKAKVKSRKAQGSRTRIRSKARDSKARDAFITRGRLDMGTLVKQVEFPGAGAI